MQASTLIFAVLVLAAISYYLGRNRSVVVSRPQGGIRSLHSLPSYYGFLTALWCGLPALALFAFWQAFETTIITDLVVSELPTDVRELPKDELGLVINDIQNMVSGNIVSSDMNASMLAAVERYKNLETISSASLSVIAISLALLGMAFGWRLISPELAHP